MIDAKVTLKGHLKKKGISIRRAARELHVTHATVIGWLNGRSVPLPVFRGAIERWSGGEVRAIAWRITDRERLMAAHAESVDVPSSRTD